MNMNDMFPSKWLAKEDVLARPGEVWNVTISLAERQMVKGQFGQEEKTILHMSGAKPMILNKSNGKTLVRAFGNSENWPGKLIELYVDPDVEYGGKVTGGIRIRIPSENGAAKYKPAAQVWTVEQARSQVSMVGILWEDVVAKLKAEGRQGWNGARDTPLAQAMIAAKAGQGKANPVGEEIPF